MSNKWCQNDSYPHTHALLILFNIFKDVLFVLLSFSCFLVQLFYSFRAICDSRNFPKKKILINKMVTILKITAFCARMTIIWLDILLHSSLIYVLRYIFETRLYSKTLCENNFPFLDYLLWGNFHWMEFFLYCWMGSVPTFDDTCLHNKFIRTMWLMLTVPEAMEWMDCRWNRNRLFYQAFKNTTETIWKQIGVVQEAGVFFISIWMNNNVRMTDLIVFWKCNLFIIIQI